jgi:hypothetical protein
MICSKKNLGAALLPFALVILIGMGDLIKCGSLCFGMAYYYVDPDYNLNTGDGSSARPWSSLKTSWNIINEALSKDDVTIFFSAREENVDEDQNYNKANENWTGVIALARTDTSTHRLILDGKSKYNRDDLSPTWKDNDGLSRAYIHGATQAIAGFREQGLQNYITIRGFRLAPHARKGTCLALSFFGGNYFIFEDNITRGGFVYFEYASSSEGTIGNGGCVDILFRNNDISHARGEGLYIGGQGNSGKMFHRNIRIEGNKIHGCGATEGEGDGIDIKDGNRAVSVHNNEIFDNAACGIASHSGGDYYNNKVYRNGDRGIVIDTYWGVVETVLLYNNVVFSNRKAGIRLNNEKPSGFQFAEIYNNSCSGNSVNFSLSGIKSIVLMNNVSANAALLECSVYGNGKIINNFNNFHGKVEGLVKGKNCFGSNPQFVSHEDLRLRSGSPCLNAGTEIQKVKIDFEGLKRPTGVTFAIGAYETGVSGN